jgi:CheY-like chemotaxis protein
MFMTAKESPDDIQAEKEAGGVAHLTKPVNTKSLISEVRKLLG